MSGTVLKALPVQLWNEQEVWPVVKTSVLLTSSYVTRMLAILIIALQSRPTHTLSHVEQGMLGASPRSRELAPTWFLLPPPFHLGALTSDCVG